MLNLLIFVSTYLLPEKLWGKKMKYVPILLPCLKLQKLWPTSQVCDILCHLLPLFYPVGIVLSHILKRRICTRYFEIIHIDITFIWVQYDNFYVITVCFLWCVIYMFKMTIGIYVLLYGYVCCTFSYVKVLVPMWYYWVVLQIFRRWALQSD